MFLTDDDEPRLQNDPAGGAWHLAQGRLWVSRTQVRPGWWSTAHSQHVHSGWWPLFLQGLRQEVPLRPWESG